MRQVRYILVILLFVLTGNLCHAHTVSIDAGNIHNTAALCQRSELPDNEAGHYDHSCIAPEIANTIHVQNADQKVFGKFLSISAHLPMTKPTATDVVNRKTIVQHPYPIDYYIFSLHRILV